MRLRVLNSELKSQKKVVNCNEISIHLVPCLLLYKFWYGMFWFKKPIEVVFNIIILS